MGDRNFSEEGVCSSIFTVKNIIRTLCLFCVIFVFCPSFIVSCSDQSITVSTMTAASGYSPYSGADRLVEGHPILYLCLIIPILIFFLLFVKQIKDQELAAIVFFLSSIDLIIYCILRKSLYDFAFRNFCEASTTIWYWINLICIAFIVGISFLVIIKRLKIDSDFRAFIYGNGTLKAINEVSDAVDRMTDVVTKLAESSKDESKKLIRYLGKCPYCGALIESGNKFCVGCGNAVPDKIANSRICNKCGAILDQDSLFCVECGAKVVD